MDAMIATVVRLSVGIARLFQDVFVRKENGFVIRTGANRFADTRVLAERAVLR
jgi:hypothetical protein